MGTQVSRPILHLQMLEPKRSRRHLEDQLQRQLIGYWQRAYPKTWAGTVHVPSGMAAQSRRIAAIFKGLGWKAGLPDLLCFVRLGGYSGLAIELKSGVNKPTPAQAGWLALLEQEGWAVGVFHDLAAAGDFLDRYHAGTQP
jgi:hypothetical protein